MSHGKMATQFEGRTGRAFPLVRVRGYVVDPRADSRLISRRRKEKENLKGSDQEWRTPKTTLQLGERKEKRTRADSGRSEHPHPRDAGVKGSREINPPNQVNATLQSILEASWVGRCS